MNEGDNDLLGEKLGLMLGEMLAEGDKDKLLLKLGEKEELGETLKLKLLLKLGEGDNPRDEDNDKERLGLTLLLPETENDAENDLLTLGETLRARPEPLKPLLLLKLGEIPITNGLTAP